MTKEGINAIVQLLNRVDLKGNEVPIFNKVIAELQEEFQKAEEPEIVDVEEEAA